MPDLPTYCALVVAYLVGWLQIQSGVVEKIEDKAQMSKLDEAMRDFDAVLGRLDRALGGRSVRAEARGALESQIAALKEDRARLAEELDVMRADVRRMEGLNARASTEIGATLKDINRLLS